MMKQLYAPHNFPVLCTLLILIGTLASLPARAVDSGLSTITIQLGDYRFSPSQVELVAGRPARLILVNTDNIIPHNFTLKDKAGGLNLDVNIAAGKTREIEFVPQTPGAYQFFCNKKLPLMKSHRDRGMQGNLDVTVAK